MQAGGPPLWLASISEAGAQRAAKYATNFLPQGLRRLSFDPWHTALKSNGRDPTDFRVGLIRSVLVTDDRNTDWAAVRAAERYRMELYQRFHEESGEGFDEQAGERVPQTWVIGNVDECVEQIVSLARRFGVTDMMTMAVPPGLRPADMSQSLERLFRDVAPRVKAQLAHA